MFKILIYTLFTAIAVAVPLRLAPEVVGRAPLTLNISAADPSAGHLKRRHANDLLAQCMHDRSLKLRRIEHSQDFDDFVERAVESHIAPLMAMTKKFDKTRERTDYLQELTQWISKAEEVFADIVARTKDGIVAISEMQYAGEKLVAQNIERIWGNKPQDYCQKLLDLYLTVPKLEPIYRELINRLTPLPSRASQQLTFYLDDIAVAHKMPENLKGINKRLSKDFRADIMRPRKSARTILKHVDKTIKMIAATTDRATYADAVAGKRNLKDLKKDPFKSP
ncbi:hypothetical protein K470DRAFT_295053 [Piedraia hortae CBS 480.64]|uniref:Uncharacterized protein n=1 Tax=Piedraia hortae CBS 480.64 TaxID=1314780 RepID=A0A6A7BYM0_9PEZI|nr:hypothetical protein K470DRAFT_295053 [Piedraia hortae CBS 480.64]